MNVAHRLGPTVAWSLVVLLIAVVGSILLPVGLLYTGTLTALFVLASSGLTLLMGHAGQISLGQGAFLAFSAYVVGFLTVKLGVSLFVAAVAAIALTVFVAYIVGFPVLQLRGHALAVATLALAIIVHTLAINLVSVTGGAVGLVGLPGLEIAGWSPTPQQFFVIAWVIALAVMLFLRNVIDSRIGRALRALGADETTTESLGVRVWNYRLHAFAFSAGIAGLAGVLYAVFLRVLTPGSFGVQLSIFLVLIAALGGLRHPFGVLVGAVIVQALTEALQVLAENHALPARVPVALDTLIYGLAIVAVMKFLPDGLAPALERGAARLLNGLRRRGAKTVRPWLTRRKRDNSTKNRILVRRRVEILEKEGD